MAYRDCGQLLSANPQLHGTAKTVTTLSCAVSSLNAFASSASELKGRSGTEALLKVAQPPADHRNEPS